MPQTKNLLGRTNTSIHPIDPLCITTILTQEGCTITTIHPIDPLCTTTILTQEELQQ